nr:hypothetical protein [Pyxidicoccus trucidator]
MDRHLRSAVGLLREGSAARAFGQLARASRTEAMTPRLAAALVRFALLAGTEAAAITLLDATQGGTPEVRRAVQRQLARVLRRVGQLPRAIAALEAVLAEFPEDRRARHGLQVLKKHEARARGDVEGGTEAPAGRTAEPAATVSGVLAKLPTRKAGVQAPAVWDEDSGYREVTLVEPASDGSEEAQPPEPREATAVAFPSVASAEPREPTAVAFPSVASSEPREPTAVAFPSVASAEPREPTAVASPVVAPPPPHAPWSPPEGKPDAARVESRSKTELEMPALGMALGPTEKLPVAASSSRPAPEASKTLMELPAVVLPASKPASEASKTVVEMPAVAISPSPPPLESRPTVVEMPAVVVPSSTPTVEPRKAAVEPPATSSTVPSEQRSGSTGGQHLSVPWSDSPEDEEHEAPPPVKRDAPPPPYIRAGAWTDDEATGEVTSEAPPPPPADEPRGAPPLAKSPGAQPPQPMSPVDTQEVSMADLQAALSGARPSGATPARADGAGAPLPAATVGSAPTARADGADTLAPGAGRAPGARVEAGPGLKPEDAEELARSQKLEAQLIARQAWRELAQLYLKRADRAKDASVRAEALTRLAEVMENELQDPAGAARMYREIVDLTGDRSALREQVRLLSTRGDASLVRRALDEAIQRARSARARAGALLTRGERWLHMGEPTMARVDFEAAEALVPGLLPVLAGLLRCVSEAERPATAERLRVALAAAPRRAPDRLEGLRMLAQAAEESLGDLRMAQWAWTEVLAESPESEQARGQLVALARKLGDPKALGQLLRAQLARESRGPPARQARLELVSTLEALGDDEAALNELRQAVRYEPGHKEAWLLLVDRLTARGSMGEAAWALEHAATAMEDEQERERAWERLARLWRDVLRDSERAQVFARRAESLRQAREEREVPPPEPPRSATPRREPSGPKSPLIPAPATLSLTPSGIAALANEVTSTTDPGAVPAVVEPPSAGRERAGKKARKGDAPSSSRKGKRASQSDKASEAPDVKGGAASPRAERTSVAPPAPGVAVAPGVPVGRAEQRNPAPVGASPAPKAPGRAEPPRLSPSEPAPKSPARAEPPRLSPAEPSPKSPARAEPPRLSPSEPAPKSPARPEPPRLSPSASADPVPKSPARAEPPRPAPSASASPAPKPSARPEPPRLIPSEGADPAAKAPAAQRGPASRGDKAPPPRAPQPVSDDEPSVMATRALGASGRVPAPQARGGAAEGESLPRSKSAMDIMAEQSVDLGSAPVAETRVISWEAPPGPMQQVRRIVRARPEGTVTVAAPARPATAKPSAPEAPARVGPGASETREAPAVSEPYQDTEPNAFKHLRERPLDAKPYRESAEYFDSRGDPGRASLMREIADALDGRESPAAPRLQRPKLTLEERAGLRHPGLRTPSGELLACAGIALCRLFPAQGRAAGTSEPLRASAGPGAPAILDALHTAARVLDVHLPELVLAEDDGPPFTAVHAGQPRLLVGRLSIRQPLSAAELRFHAGRALLSLSPDLMALRALKGGQLLRALALLSTILKDPRASGPEARVVRDSLSPRALERTLALLDAGTRDFNSSALADAARDSANRAGLVACGSVGPALAILRARRNQDSELVELLRFAASERYYELREQRASR